MNRKGSVVIISLWILVILALGAVGLGHRAAVTARLADYQKEKLKAACLARAGFNAAVSLLRIDRDANAVDHLNETWSTGVDPQTNMPLFENQPIQPERADNFSVRYLYDAQKNRYLCMSDEERKISIKAFDALRQKQFFELLVDLDWDRDRCSALVDLIAAWIKETSGPATAADEERFYKHAPLAATEELLPILEFFYMRDHEEQPRLKARQAYEKIADYITVYTDGTLNINTASALVLHAAMNALVLAGDLEAVEGDVDDLVRRIITYRGQGGVFADVDPSATAAALEAIGAPLDTGQKNILSSLKPLTSVQSSIFRIEARGVTAKKISHDVIGVASRRGTPKILFWHEQ